MTKNRLEFYRKNWQRWILTLELDRNFTTTNCLKLIPWVTPLNEGELKVLEGTHRTDPIELRGGEVGLKKHSTPHKKVLFNDLHWCYYKISIIWSYGFLFIKSSPSAPTRMKSMLLGLFMNNVTQILDFRPPFPSLTIPMVYVLVPNNLHLQPCYPYFGYIIYESTLEGLLTLVRKN